MDSKADDQALFCEFRKQRGMTLVTCPRKGSDKTPERKKMVRFLRKPAMRRLYKQRAVRVEPMQGLVAEIFGLDRCWMRGNENNRWLFAAMGVAVQMHQSIAYKEGRSPWKIKGEGLGLW